MPDTRSKKKSTSHKALKTPKRVTPVSPAVPPRRVKSKRKKGDSRMDRMEEQIAALTSLVSAQLSIAAQRQETPERQITSETPTPKKKVKRRPRRAAFPPPPEAMAAAPGIQEHIHEALKQLDPSYKPTGGKNTEPATAKPHLFIPKRPRDSKLKVSEQEDIPFAHFVTGMAGMVLSMMDDQASPAAAACRHLREAAEDHITRPWPTVREWSKTLFDRLALGEIEWDDYEEMHRERIKICFSAPPKVATIVPCPFFSAGNCDHTNCHEEGDLSLRHICPFCYVAGGGRQDHPIFKCNSKRAYNTTPKLQFNKQYQKPKQDTPAKN